MTRTVVDKQFSLCLLTDEHLNDCTGIYIDAYSREPWCEHYDYDAVCKYIKKQLGISNFMGCILKLNGEIVGQVFGFIIPTVSGDNLRIEDFCISPKYQNIGAGSALISLLCEYLKSKRIDGIILNTVSTFPSYSFYKKNGFSDLEESSTLFLNVCKYYKA